MARSSHPKNEVEETLGHAKGQGWRVEFGGGNHARAMRRVVDNYTTHREQREADDDAKE